MDGRDSSDQQNSSGNDSHTAEADINSSDKRKREPEQDPAQQNSSWKTSLCSYFRRSNAVCKNGESCRYAHGEAELRPRPGNTWDPTSKRAKNIGMTEVGGKEDEEEEGYVMMTEGLEVEGEDISSGLCKSLMNLPSKWTSDDLKKFLSEQGIIFKSAMKKKGMLVGFVTFESLEKVEIAVKELHGKSVINNRTLKIANIIPTAYEKTSKVALPPNTTRQVGNSSPDCDSPDITASTINDDGDYEEEDGSVPNCSVLNGRSVRDAVCPLAHMPYSDQLEHKKNSVTQTLRKLTRNMIKACRNGVSQPEWIRKAKEIGGLSCKLEGIIESPVINGYRNKCEFSVGKSLQGKPTVGFLLGNFREGVTAVEEPVDCPHVSLISCKYASIFQDFLQHSHLPLWNRLNNIGFWRQLTVREGRAPGKTAEVENLDSIISEVMLIVQICTVGFDDGLVKDELEKLAHAFSVGSSMESLSLPLTELIIQDHIGISNAAPSDSPLPYVFVRKDECDFGLQIANDVVEPKIHDYVCNLRFSISPTAFFQVNTLAAEKLYSLAGDWAGLGPDTLLFDICCGTGTIGLCLAHHVGMVVGIEMNAAAVRDAQRNADMNGIKNCNFVCGKAENVIGSLMKDYIPTLQKHDEICDKLENNDHKSNNAEEKITDVDCRLDHVDDCGGSKDSKDEDQLQRNHNSENTASVWQFKNIVAIVDPPRGGLHPTVIKVLRTEFHLKRLVYISCNPETLMANAIELCAPSSDKTQKDNNQNRRQPRGISAAGVARQRIKSMPSSEPFKPIKAMAVDLFPHTNHCELVMLLER